DGEALQTDESQGRLRRLGRRRIDEISRFLEAGIGERSEPEKFANATPHPTPARRRTPRARLRRLAPCVHSTWHDRLVRSPIQQFFGLQDVLFALHPRLRP